MTTVRDIIKRDINVKVEGVVKVFDHSALATELREYVVTDKIEAELKKIFDTFTRASDSPSVPYGPDCKPKSSICAGVMLLIGFLACLSGSNRSDKAR